MYNLVDLTDKKILVAGASSGIGKATAILLSKMGAKVALLARREDKLKEVLSEMEGEGHAFFVADLSEVSSIEIYVKKIIDEFGILDGLVYTAGISPSQPMGMFTPEKVENVFRINYFAFFELVRQITKKRRYNDGLRIVTISSVASVIGDKAQTQYAATKGAMNSAIRCMAHELAEKGISINAVAPGMTATGMYEGFLSKYGEDSESNRNILETQYVGIINPVDIANSIAFLLSSASRFITGVTLFVAGGMAY